MNTNIQIDVDLSLLDNNPRWYSLKNIHNEEVLSEHFQNETQGNYYMN
jgi:hypothetical protein